MYDCCFSSLCQLLLSNEMFSTLYRFELVNRYVLDVTGVAERITLAEVQKCIICMMHAENRKNEKLFQCCINAHTVRLGRGDKLKDFMNQVTVYMTNEHLGDVENGKKRRWTFPDFKKDSTAVLNPSLTLEISRKWSSAIPAINKIGFVIHEDDTRLTKNKNADLLKQWNELYSKYAELMIELNRHEPYSTNDADGLEEILKLEDKCNRVFHLFVTLNGREQVTNYFHILGAMHTTYFIRKYGSLYRYSQQVRQFQSHFVKLCQLLTHPLLHFLTGVGGLELPDQAFLFPQYQPWWQQRTGTE